MGVRIYVNRKPSYNFEQIYDHLIPLRSFWLPVPLDLSFPDAFFIKKDFGIS